MEFEIQGLPEQEKEQKTYSFEEKGNNAEVSILTEVRIKTLADLVRACEIDTGTWEIERWVCNKWEMAYKLGASGEGGHQVVDLWQVKAWLKKRVDFIELTNIKDAIIEEMKNYAPIYPSIIYTEPLGELTLEIDMPDLHFGKLAWAEESGDDYDIKIAEQMALEHTQSIINQTLHYKFDKIIYPIGNDYFNVNSKLNTTINNTPQQEDTRSQKTFVKGRMLAVKLIEMLSQLAPVDVIIVPGNHDEERTFYLGDSLYCWFHQNPNVTVDNRATKRKYKLYGKNLIGFTHGCNEKINELPLLMSLEQPDLWAQSQYREWQTGDKHHKKEIKTSMKEHEQKGVMVRILRSLSGNDAWHFDKGFIGGSRKIEAFVRHNDKGLIAQIHSCV